MKIFVVGFAIICLSASTVAMAQDAPFPSSASEERGDTAAHSDQDREIFAGDLRKELRGTLTSTAPADASRPPDPAPSELPAAATEPEAAGVAPPNPALSELPATATEPEAAGVTPPNPALPGLSAANTAAATSPTPISRKVIKPRTAKRPMTMADRLKAFMREAFTPSAKAPRSAPKPVASTPPRRASAPRSVRPQG